MTPEQRKSMVDQLERSYEPLPRWAKTAVKHSLGAPSVNPKTGELITSFREAMDALNDDALEMLHDDFESNGDLLP